MITLKTEAGETSKHDDAEAIRLVQEGYGEPTDRRTFNRLKAAFETRLGITDAPGEPAAAVEAAPGTGDDGEDGQEQAGDSGPVTKKRRR